ncbi:restriction endonuclease subunit S [Aquimarina sp. D1M17]|uniref:restriction endonuclease subunit S n=1 Tax=Aquimarina acroporae TaxID=2937283 RepID=UPI0020BF9AA5|nr:restriction endonuclease subunit S [Aquimarina acroporae]MCK8521939.1 restriction endonuclease subunit S [Aquimarina acroporae]
MRKDWEYCELQKHIKLIDYRGRTPKKTDNGVKLITAKNVKLGYLQEHPEEFIAENNYEEWMKRGIPEYGDVIFTTEAPLANVAQLLTHEKVAFAQRTIVMQPTPNILDKTFLKYLLLSPQIRNDIFSNGTGATVTGIKSSLLKKIKIPIPPLTQQKQIVTILDKTFAAIDTAKVKTEQNLQYAKDIFDNYLQGVLSDNKWSIVKLGEVCQKVEYGSSSKSSPEGKLPVLRMGNIQDRKFVWDNLKYSNNEQDNKKYLLKYNDVLFNRTNSPELVGKAAIYKGEMPSIFAGYLIRIHRKEDLLDADYLNYYLNSQIAKNYGNSVVISSVNQANINGTKLKTYPIPLPSLKEQQEIVQKLDALSVETKRLEAIYTQKIADLEELKKSVLQKAFSGQLNTIN